MRGNVIVH